MGAYDEWRTQDPPRYYWSGYPTTCVVGSLVQKSGAVAVRDDSVWSYRGPIGELKVGSKKRRIFRKFYLRKYQLNQPSTMLWCPGPLRLAGIDITVFQTVALIGYNRIKAYPASYVGSKFPLYGSSDMLNYGLNRRNQVTTDLYVKLKEPRFDSAVVLAELGETLTSVKDLLWGALKAMNRTRYAVKQATHFILNAEELWLWYRYFLLPAMLDTEDLLKAIKPQASIDRVQAGKKKQKKVTTGTIYSRGWSGGAVWEIPWRQTITNRCGGAIDITKRLDANEWGLSAVDIMRGTWEVIPFSFVFDWFVNLGDFLTTLRDVQIEYAQSYATMATESKLELLPGKDVQQDINPVIREVCVERIVDLEPPSHPLAVREWSSALRTVDAIALACGIIKNVMSKGRR